jgi:hypothetical protein
VTIEDPLVSRKHAKILIEGDRAVLHDLGSRNGVRVNGELVRSMVDLVDRDRLRIGTQEFVFHTVTTGVTRHTAKSTGFLRYCEQCSYPYPEEMHACPNCGHMPVREVEESTVSGVLGENRPNWADQLLIELLDRALAIGRWEEAEKVLRRASAALDDRLSSGSEVDSTQFVQLTACASRVAQALQAPKWAYWLIHTSSRLQAVPSADVVARLRTIPLREEDGVAQAIDATLRAARARSVPLRPEDLRGLTALEQWRKDFRPPS